MWISGCGWIELPKCLRLSLCRPCLDSVLSELESWETYDVLNSLVDLLDAWMVFRASLNSLLSSELDASAGAFSEKMDSCEGCRMGCSRTRVVHHHHYLMRKELQRGKESLHVNEKALKL